MEREIIKKWVNKRLSSAEYMNFVLSNLFYDGKVPEYPVSPDGLYALTDEDCIPLVYNPLRRNVKKKTSYLLGRPYTVSGRQEVVNYLSDALKVQKDTVEELYKKGEAWWEFEPDQRSPLRFKITLRKAESVVPHYIDEEKTQYDSVGYLWNRVDDLGNVSRYADFVDSEGRHRFALDGISETENLAHAIKNGADTTFKSLPFVRLKSDGLYQLISHLGVMYSNRYKQADILLEDNADPVAVVKNASDTDAGILHEDIKENKLVKVEGTGDFSYASKSMDYNSIESFMKMLKSDISDLCGVVSREQELNYVTSGRALDRLYVDMDSDAADMGSVLKDALKAFLSFVSEEVGKDLLSNFDIVYNTDKPTDEQTIIQNITSSKDFLSKRTLLEQHPWVSNVDEEMQRIEEEESAKPEPVETPPVVEGDEIPGQEEVIEEEEETQE